LFLKGIFEVVVNGNSFNGALCPSFGDVRLEWFSQYNKMEKKTHGLDMVCLIRDHRLGIRITGHGIRIRGFGIRIDSKSQYFNLGSWIKISKFWDQGSIF